MKYLDEFRDAQLVKKLVNQIQNTVTQAWTIMEICGGQTHAIMKHGLSNLLPPEINIVHGPGCPVCVTPVIQIDKALYLAQQENVILVSFGDMLRVPGTQMDLLSVKAKGADVRTVLSPLEALQIAKNNPDKEIVFFAVGFETTAPAIALAIAQAKKLQLPNFSALISHVLVPPAIDAILSNPSNTIQGFLAAGHVCTIMGYQEYEPLAKKYKTPIVVSGFEPVDLLLGILQLIELLEKQEYTVKNAYGRLVQYQGNTKAQDTLFEVFEPANQIWRGIGTINNSGLKLKPDYLAFDAEEKFNLSHVSSKESDECRAGEVLTGVIKPFECQAFNKGCTPESPLGAPMVSSEGACAAYIKYLPETLNL